MSHWRAGEGSGGGGGCSWGWNGGCSGGKGFAHGWSTAWREGGGCEGLDWRGGGHGSGKGAGIGWGSGSVQGCGGLLCYSCQQRTLYKEVQWYHLKEDFKNNRRGVCKDCAKMHWRDIRKLEPPPDLKYQWDEQWKEFFQMMDLEKRLVQLRQQSLQRHQPLRR